MEKPITIYMTDLVHDILPGNYVVPLNVASISAYVKSVMGEDIRIELFKSPGDLLPAIKKAPPHILALSNYMWNMDLSVQVGKHVKECSPATVVVMGGPGARTDKEGIKQFLKKHPPIDLYMLYEGEQPFLNLIKKILGKKGLQDNALRKTFADGEVIKGCAYLMDDDVVHSTCDLLQNLDVIPSPYLTGLLDKFLVRKYIPLFESNRGCPFSCIYCTWGTIVLKKVRAFPIERVLEEMEYVAKKNPDIPYWIIADANFGILNRDVAIARKIKSIREKTPALGRVDFWANKNWSKNSKEIAQILGGIERHLVAVQTLDPKVQQAIGRANIKQDDIPSFVKKLKNKGITVHTDVICGLPEETHQSHMDTLRKCLDIDFDMIDVRNISLLPGSELESDVSRERFSLKTKFRLRQGCYGIYDGLKAIECEEMVVGTSCMTEEEMLEFRMIHWLLWFCWNSDFLKEPLRYLKVHHGINPMDLFINLIRCDKTNWPRVGKLFDQFLVEAKEERFDSAEEARKYYSKENKFDELMKGGFSKMNFKFTALFILDTELYGEFCALVREIATNLTTKKIPDGLFILAKELIVEANKVFSDKVVLEKNISVECNVVNFLSHNEVDKSEGYANIKLYKSVQDIDFLKGLLRKYEFNKIKRLAIEKSLEVCMSEFSYRIDATPS